ncbi:MAG: restriction endonuclease [Bacteroidota bacterium]
MKNIWMVRAGRKAYLVEDFISQGLIAIGWNSLGDLSKVDELEQIKSLLVGKFPEMKLGSIYSAAGQIYRFRKEIVKDALVLTYNPSERVYWLGKVTSAYEFKEGEFDYHHIRKVSWEYQIDRDRLSASTRNSLGSISTIFKLPEEAATEVLTMANNQELPAELPEEEELEQVKDDIEDKANEFLKDKIVKLNWEEMQELVAGILRAMGYKTQVSPKGPDRGKDILASPDGLGLEDPKIVVEVKHRKGSMGSPAVRSLLGGLRQNDKALFVSTGGFTKEAKYEAERANNHLTLIDLDLLVSLIYQYYDNFDSESRTLLPLKKIYWPI